MPTNPGWGYRVVAWVLGVALIVAGGLKVYAAARPEKPVAGPSWQPLSGAAVGGAEMLFGGWMIAGLLPRATRLAALAVFIAMSNVALYKALAGEKSCGCLGRVQVEPWFAVGFDGLAVLALLLARPPTALEAVPLRRGLVLSWVATILIAVGWAGGPAALRRPVEPGTAPTPTEQDLVERVIRDIESNSASYKTLAFEVEKTSFFPLVKEPATVETKMKGGVSTLLEFRPKAQARYTFTVAGTSIRRDSFRDGKLSDIQVDTDQHRTDYHITDKRAWLRKPETPFLSSTPIVDRSMWGMTLPLAFPRDWFNQVHVTAARETDQGIEIEAETLPTFKRPTRFKVIFAAAHKHLPIRYEQLNPEGGIETIIDATYQRLPDRDGWLLKYRAEQYWGGVSTSPDPATMTFRSEFRVLDGVQVDAALPANHFQITFPAGTRIHDVTRPGGTVTTLTGSATGPDAALSRAVVVPVSETKPLTDAKPPSLWPFGVWNTVLLLACVVFRHRLVI